MRNVADGMPKELKCPRDCVHHAEGCMLGYPFEQIGYLMRHDPLARQKIAEVRSDDFRIFWTSALCRAGRPDVPPCYHNHDEALPDCKYSVCGHLPDTVRNANEAVQQYEQRMREEFEQRFFVIDTTGLDDNMTITLGRIRSNAPECLMVTTDEDGLEGLLRRIREAIQEKLGSCVRRVSIYSAQSKVRNHPWASVLDGVDSSLDYLAVWDIVRPTHFVSKSVLHTGTQRESRNV